MLNIDWTPLCTCAVLDEFRSRLLSKRMLRESAYVQYTVRLRF